MESSLAGHKIALLVANGFEELEMTEPQRAFLAAGASLSIVSHEQGLVNGWHEKGWGHFFPVDVPLSSALAADFDALVVPGGGRGVERLIANPHARRFVKGFADGAKPMVLVGHGALLLAAAERANGRRLAASGEAADRLTAAGATVSADPQVTDDNILSTQAEGDPAALKQAAVAHVAEIVGRVDAAA